LCQADHLPYNKRPPQTPIYLHFVIVFSVLDTRLLDLCYMLVIIEPDKRSYQWMKEWT
jgi:hypothetical protein